MARTYELVGTVRARAAELGKKYFRLIALHCHDDDASGLRYDHFVADGPHIGEEVIYEF